MSALRQIQVQGLKKIGMICLLVGFIALFLPQATGAFPLLQTGPYTVVVTFESIIPNPAYVNQTATLTVLVQAATGVPPGTVLVQSGETLLCTLTLDAAGRASCTHTPLQDGSVPLKAVYLGQSPYLPGVSADEYLTVLPQIVPQIQVLSHIPNPSVINRVVAVSVAVGPETPVPTGIITVYRSSSPACLIADRLAAVDTCSAALDTSGSANCLIPLTQAGDVPLCVYYGGDTPHLEGVSAPVIHRVSLANTFTTITSTTPNPSLEGQSVWVNFTVESPDGTPSGNVVVTSGSLTCTATVAAGRCALNFTTPDAQTVVAAYAGGLDGSVVLDPSVSDPYSHVVVVPPTDILLSNAIVDSYRSAGWFVGTLSSVDANPTETHTYALVPGIGDSDNDRFSISDQGLFTADSFDPGEDLQIRVRSTDAAGLSVEKVFTLTVLGDVLLPNTGFPAGRVSAVPARSQPVVVQQAGDLSLEIPRLGGRVQIVGVPKTGASWDTDWLGPQAGWLEGSAFPTWQGNSVLVGHNYLPSGLPGPFAALGQLQKGDRLLIHVYGQTVAYQVRSVRRIDPGDLSVLEHSDTSILTLLTCASYDEAAQAYRYRIVVQAVLVDHP